MDVTLLASYGAYVKSRRDDDDRVKTLFQGFMLMMISKTFCWPDDIQLIEAEWRIFVSVD